jgi:hypothetical protein
VNALQQLIDSAPVRPDESVRVSLLRRKAEVAHRIADAAEEAVQISACDMPHEFIISCLTFAEFEVQFLQSAIAPEIERMLERSPA